MAGERQLFQDCSLSFANDILHAIRQASSWAALRAITRDFTDAIGFRYFALITHEDLRDPRPGAIDLRDYAEGAARRIIGECSYLRDPVIRGAIFADCAYLWSDLHRLIRLDNRDRIALELGKREGLDQGITVPCSRLGQRLGSCTFAGLKTARCAELMLGPAQMFGIFAFQRARSLAGRPYLPAQPPRLEPRYRDCVVLAGQGLRDKVIAHKLGLTPRTVESYMRDARRLFGARDRTELVTAAVLAGEIDLAELRSRQAP